MSTPTSLSPDTVTSLLPDIGEITEQSEPLLLGYLLQWALFGVLSAQVYIYYLAFPNDSLQKKLLVYAVYAAEMVQAILLARMVYIQFAAGFGNPNALNAIPVILWFAVPILNSIVAAVVQIFYAYKIKMLADSYLIPSVVILFAFLQLGGGITVGVLSAKIASLSQVLNKNTYIAVGICFGSSAVCDVLNAVYVTYLLSQRNSALKQTQRLIQKIMRLTIETGMLIAAFAIINFVLVLIPSKSLYSLAVCLVLGKMHSNTMMVVLNSRMVYGIENDTISESSNKPSSILVSVSVTHEQRSDPLEHSLEDLRMTTLSTGSLERHPL